MIRNRQKPALSQRLGPPVRIMSNQTIFVLLSIPPYEASMWIALVQIVLEYVPGSLCAPEGS